MAIASSNVSNKDAVHPQFCVHDTIIGKRESDRVKAAYQNRGNIAVLNEYMDKAMQRATFKQLADGTTFGSIPGFQGVWADADTEAACREELREVLEGWILLGIANHETFPEVDGMKLEIGKLV